MKSSQAISHVTVELVSKISKTVFVSIIRVNVISIVFTCYISAESCHLPQPRPHGEKQEESDSGWCPVPGLHGELLFVAGYHEYLRGNLVPLSTHHTNPDDADRDSHWKLNTNSTLTRLVTQKDFIVTSNCENFKSCIFIQFFQKAIPYFLLLSDYMKVHVSV